MTTLLALLGVAAITWGYRVTFTAVVGADRLPARLRSRMDAVGPAAFSALVMTELATAEAAAIPAFVLALLAAGAAAWKSRSLLVSVGLAIGVFGLVTAM